MVADQETGTDDRNTAQPCSSSNELASRLAEFLTNNPASTLEEMEVETGKKEVVIRRPWGDASISIRVQSDIEALSDALNQLYLPEQFTGIWHRDTKHFEIIWTAQPLPSTVADIRERAFTFRFKENGYHCNFGLSSDRLLLLAKHFIPSGPSSTQYRNLPSFNIVLSRSDDAAAKPFIGEPLSFWIKNVEWNSDEILELVNHLNFYMTYYDTRSPNIVVHSLASENEATRPQIRYIAGHFPSQITGREIDDNLLHFWLAARTGDSARRFLYYYRIIEYASFYYLQNNTRIAIRRILSAPNALDELDTLTERVISSLAESALDDYKRFEAVVRDLVSIGLLWDEIRINEATFSAEITFDGGFKLPALIKIGWKIEDFTVNGIGAFVRNIRDTRNALSHGRDQRTLSVIVPTLSNFRRLQPWVSLVAVAAGQVIAYRHLI